LILTRVSGAGDLRAIGSGNIGATNVLRTGRKGLAAATLVLDVLKGALAVWTCSYFSPMYGPLAAFAAFVGHLYPIWLRFRGGKGVATLLGIALGLSLKLCVILAVIWVLAMLLTRYSSVGGMAAAITGPVASAAIGRFDLTLLFLFCAMMVLWKHRANIVRLLEGTEPRIGQASSS
jgi:glycerol-3-phosphate acyltransferase PlsY